VRMHVKLNCYMIFMFLFIVFQVVCIIIYTVYCILTIIIWSLNFFVCSASRKYEPVGHEKHLTF